MTPAQILSGQRVLASASAAPVPWLLSQQQPGDLLVRQAPGGVAVNEYVATRKQKAPAGHVAFTLLENSEYGRKGEIVTMAVTPDQVTVQTEELDTYLGGYTPFGFAADMVSKVILVDKEAGQRRDFSKENAFENVDVRSGRNAPIKEVDHQSGLTSYRTEEFALATYIPWATENDATTLYNIRAASGETVAWKLTLAREVRVFGYATTLTNWATTNRTTLLSAGQWDTGSTKNPRSDLQARIKASAQPITDIFMNPDVAYYFLSDSEVRLYMKQMLGDGAPNPDVAAAASTGEYGVQSFSIPGLPPIHVCPAKVLNLSTGALDYVLADDVLLVTNQPGVPRDGHRIASLMTFRTKGRSGVGIVTNEYIPNGRGINGGTMFEMGYGETTFTGSNIAGGLIKDVLSSV